MNISVRHVFSVEIDATKRSFIMKAHTKEGCTPNFHMFEDVELFKSGSGFCHTCQCKQGPPSTVDSIFAGPSCKKLSLMFADRKEYFNCYETGDGCSGFTYRHGVCDAISMTNPAVLFFENVLGVADSKVVNGKKSVPPIQATNDKIVSYMHIYIYICIYIYTVYTVWSHDIE